MKKLILLIIAITLCYTSDAQIFKSKKKKNKTNTTGWQYNDTELIGVPNENIGLHKLKKNAAKYFEGVKLIQGGTFISGRLEQINPDMNDSTLIINSSPRRISVSSFYLCEHEVTNAEYREFTNWVKELTARKILARKYPEKYYIDGTKELKKNTIINWNDESLFGTLYFAKKDSIGNGIINTDSLIIYNPYLQFNKDNKREILINTISIYPDTLCWINEFPYFSSDVMTKCYFNHPAYDNYPVVGVSWEQANAYCEWRGERLNEAILLDEGIDIGDAYFNTQVYLAKSYEGTISSDNTKRVRMDDGLLYPNFRLASESEWEYAALSQEQEKKSKEIIYKGNIFPWKTYGLMDEKKNYLANFGAIQDINGLRVKAYKVEPTGKKSKTDTYFFTSPVKAFPANDFGLYDMAGNVAEWVMDSYGTEINENRFSFNVNIDYLVKDTSTNTLKVNAYDDIETAKKKIYKRLERSNSWIKLDLSNETDNKRLEQMAKTELHNAKVAEKQKPARIVKGGSWATGPAYMQCGSREIFNQKKGCSRIGFRVSMIKVGSVVGN